ncbi:MAG: NAD-dependent epimerase/dehydratase family protein, partial [Chitinophagaceae bacterium]
MLMKSIFITGITGLLGTNLAIDLLKNNFKVTALLRCKKKFNLINHPNLFLLEGGLFDNIDKYLENIDIFIHIAAETKQNLLNYNDYKKVNYSA